MNEFLSKTFLKLMCVVGVIKFSFKDFIKNVDGLCCFISVAMFIN